MNKEFIDEINRLKEDLKKTEHKLTEMEKKYSSIGDYRLISHLLDKLGVSYIETTIEELNKTNSVWICERREDGKIIVYRREISSNEDCN